MGSRRRSLNDMHQISVLSIDFFLEHLAMQEKLEQKCAFEDEIKQSYVFLADTYKYKPQFFARCSFKLIISVAAHNFHLIITKALPDSCDRRAEGPNQKPHALQYAVLNPINFGFV